MSFKQAEHSRYKRIWNKLSPTEKQMHIKKADLDHILNNRTNLEWNEIESNYQQKLRDSMKVK